MMLVLASSDAKIGRGRISPIGVNLRSKPFSISFPAGGWKCVLRGSASKADELRRSLRIIAPTQSMGAS